MRIGITSCFAACNNLAGLLPDDAGFDDQCTKYGQVGLFSVISKNDECTAYAIERLCSFFRTEKAFYEANGCDTHAPKLCLDDCNVR